MDLPYADKGELIWNNGRLLLNDSSFGDVRALMSMPQKCAIVQEELALFVTDSDLGEVQVLVDVKADRLLQLELELFENLPFDLVFAFLEEAGIIKTAGLVYLENEGNLFAVISMNFILRLSVDKDKVKVCTFIFYNPNFIMKNEDDFALQIRTAVANTNSASN